jgi:preprotein translocase subunit SecA
MDYLQEGIGLRAMAQRDPLVEYQREGFLLFTAMNDAIKEESVGYVFNLEVQVDATQEAQAADGEAPAEREAPVIVAKGLVTPERRAMQYSAPTVDGEGGVEVRGETVEGSDVGEYPGTPKNAPCPCGSGKKYKRCHGAA